MGEPQQLLRVLERQGASQNLALAVFTEEHVDFKKYQSGLSSLTVQRDRKDVGGVEYRGFEPKGTAVIVQAQGRSGRGCACASSGWRMSRIGQLEGCSEIFQGSPSLQM